MKMQGAIHVTTAGNLENGDLFAYETSGMLASGIVKCVAYAGHQLNEVGRDYMKGSGLLQIPDDRYEPFSSTQTLVIYQSVPWFGSAGKELSHMFMQFDYMIAVFEYDRTHYHNRSFTEIPECAE